MRDPLCIIFCFKSKYLAIYLVTLEIYLVILTSLISLGNGMKIINKSLYVFVFLIGIFIYQPNSQASLIGYSLDDLSRDQELLRHIVIEIVSKGEKINLLKDELRKKHSQESFDLWSTYNQDSMPTVEVLKTLKMSNSITQGLPINANFRTNVLRPLVGRTDFTLFSNETIENIEGYLKEAVTKGTVELAINKMLAEKAIGESLPDSIKVTFSFDKPFAHLFQKEKVMPPKVVDLGVKNRMIIILYTDQYIKALLVDKNALKTQKMDGKINTVYAE